MDFHTKKVVGNECVTVAASFYIQFIVVRTVANIGVRHGHYSIISFDIKKELPVVLYVRLVFGFRIYLNCSEWNYEWNGKMEINS